MSQTASSLRLSFRPGHDAGSYYLTSDNVPDEPGEVTIGVVVMTSALSSAAADALMRRLVNSANAGLDQVVDVHNVAGEDDGRLAR